MIMGKPWRKHIPEKLLEALNTMNAKGKRYNINWCREAYWYTQYLQYKAIKPSLILNLDSGKLDVRINEK